MYYLGQALEETRQPRPGGPRAGALPDDVLPDARRLRPGVRPPPLGPGDPRPAGRADRLAAQLAASPASSWWTPGPTSSGSASPTARPGPAWNWRWSTPATPAPSRPWPCATRRRRLFASYGDRRGEDWARFLRCTLLPYASPGGVEVGTAVAQEELAQLSRTGHAARDGKLDDYVEAYQLLLERGADLEAGWQAWRLGMVPNRHAREVMGVAVSARAGVRTRAAAGAPLTGDAAGHAPDLTRCRRAACSPPHGPRPARRPVGLSPWRARPSLGPEPAGRRARRPPPSGRPPP